MPSMEPASTSSDSPEPRKARKPGPWPPKIEPFVPNSEHNPRELKSWAKRTGFNPNFSGETQASISENGENDAGLDLGFSDKDGRIQLEKREGGKDGKELASGFGVARKRKESENRGIEIEPVVGSRGGVQDNARKRNGLENKGIEIEPMAGSRDGVRRSGMENRGIGVVPGLGVRNGENEKEKEVPGFVSKRESEVAKVVPVDGGGEVGKEVGKVEGDVEINVVLESREGDDSVLQGRPGMKYGLGDRHGIVPLIFYGMQHYLSLAGSLVLIPLVIVPAMGGTDKETATVISTMLLVSGVTTILHSYFGTRLPLVQGSSFVYLAPALVIANSREFRDLNGNKFKHIMRELQGAVIIGSIFQCILGYSGLMSFLLRLINPVVVASTVAAVGLAFFSYGFPQAGSCVEISIPQILLVLIFSLYLRRVSIFGQRIFQVYAVPFSVAIIWSYAFLLTESGAYNYKGCNPNIPSSNILLDACRRHAYTMKHCRTDVSNAWKSADWVRVPYPFQWGMPTFRLRTSIMMILVSVVATVDSVGLYHSVTLLVGSRVLTPGIVSRGIGLEGFTSILAGIWGTGTGSTTLIENIHTIAVTKMGSRRAVELGAVLLILFSFIGKIGALLASIPQALAASALCYIWGLVVALGLSTLRYCETASSRNAIIMGLSLFLSLSVPAYFQQYQPLSSFVLPSYYVPYAAASDGPVHIGNKALDYAINGLLSLNMVVAFLVAMILDNTVPGSKQERGVYIWSSNDDVRTDPSFLGDYSLPQRVPKFFRCVKCVGI